MPFGPVILNNTPLVCLWLLGRLELLHSLYAEVLIPDAVVGEFLAVESTSRSQSLSQAPWIIPTTLVQPKSALVYAGLDRGESEVLALAIECQARLVIIDERRARRYAQRLSLPLTGTLGVLLAAKQNGLITEVKPLVQTLAAAGLHFHPSILTTMFNLADEQE